MSMVALTAAASWHPWRHRGIIGILAKYRKRDRRVIEKIRRNENVKLSAPFNRHCVAINNLMQLTQ